MDLEVDVDSNDDVSLRPIGEFLTLQIWRSSTLDYTVPEAESTNFVVCMSIPVV